MVSRVLKLEGFVTLVIAVFVYQILGFSFLWFFLLILLPDIGMIGYVKNKKIGSYIYNSTHNFLTAAVFIFAGYLSGIEFLIMIGIITAAHIGMDRTLGYGLKYPTGFKHTHIQKV